LLPIIVFIGDDYIDGNLALPAIGVITPEIVYHAMRRSTIVERLRETE
jgi:hypothetical protein